jgi:hypothetical protein
MVRRRSPQRNSSRSGDTVRNDVWNRSGGLSRRRRRGKEQRW